jgi:hypothetical protein
MMVNPRNTKGKILSPAKAGPDFSYRDPRLESLGYFQSSANANGRRLKVWTFFNRPAGDGKGFGISLLFSYLAHFC